MPAQGVGETMLLAFNFEDFNSLVGGASGKAATVVIEDSMML